tara:strand:+ start:151 stop:423 length:273 start_codon:yes stop_codon:yes gene_type:complete
VIIEVFWSGNKIGTFCPSAPKADALPGCATPRLLKFCLITTFIRKKEEINERNDYFKGVQKGNSFLPYISLGAVGLCLGSALDTMPKAVP